MNAYRVPTPRDGLPLVAKLPTGVVRHVNRPAHLPDPHAPQSQASETAIAQTMREAKDDAHGFVESIRNAKKAYVDFVDTRLACEDRLHHAEMKRQVELSECSMKRQLEVADALHRAELKRKAEMQEQEVKHKRQMLDLDAEAKRRFIEGPRSANVAVKIAGKHADMQGAHDVLKYMSSCKIPETLEELGNFLSEYPLAQEKLQRHVPYEEELAAHLYHVKNELAICMEDDEAALLGSRSTHFRTSLKAWNMRVKHYCNLVFFGMVRDLLPLARYEDIVGQGFDHRHRSGVTENSKSSRQASPASCLVFSFSGFMAYAGVFL